MENSCNSCGRSWPTQSKEIPTPAQPAGIPTTDAPPKPAPSLHRARESGCCSPPGKGRRTPTSHPRDRRWLQSPAPRPGWVLHLLPSVLKQTSGIWDGGGLQVPWLYAHGLFPRGLGVLPSTAMPHFPALGAATLTRGRAVDFGAGMRAEAGRFYEVEALSKGWRHKDRSGDISGVTLSSPSVTLQVCLSGSTTE